MEKLTPLKELEHHLESLKNEFKGGEIIDKTEMEQKRVETFFNRTEFFRRNINILKSLTIDESSEIVQQWNEKLSSTRETVQELFKKSLTHNEPVLTEIEKWEKKKVKLFKEVAKRIDWLKELPEEKIDKKTRIEKTKALRDKRKKDEEKINKKVEGLKLTLMTNKRLFEIVDAFNAYAEDCLLLLNEELQTKDWVNSNVEMDIPTDVTETIAKKIRATRDIAVFQNQMGNGRHLVALKEHVLTKDNVIAYGTDKDIDLCREAKDNGVDQVAKEGIRYISNDCFDVTINYIPKFTFRKPEVGSVYGTEEEERYSYIFLRSIPKRGNGLIIFNLPYAKIPQFQKRILLNLTLDGVYRLDDDMSNVLFIARIKKSHATDQEKLLNQAFYRYETLPHYREMKEMLINKEELTLPTVFRPYVRDAQDIDEAFEEIEDTLTTVQTFYQPKESIVDQNRPLQEISPGHIPAIAAKGLTNGIYDVEGMPHIFLSKIEQQSVEEEKEDTYRGETVKIISRKRSNFIVTKIAYPDGQIIEILNTKENTMDEEEED